ncbi:hypothetical protein GCM10022402_25050 [Salinactinospora qingdaonensis]|uniref:Uncharacterized protein n=1 Tax=Salinactinospora qingdaonensis TaxID=702744 RepID=A0ABP7FRY8_9ACTN
MEDSATKQCVIFCSGGCQRSRQRYQALRPLMAGPVTLAIQYCGAPGTISRSALMARQELGWQPHLIPGILEETDRGQP